ncbi:hypothetical protein [Haliangium ochraceum]|uniref:Outer membrane protein beta-barrel domain-containing protein n=1 Tax=Haliangium ochraceum (strain DSM 14365 / JCM 11303 / SMP-2) TaxID=502025 RepID=D0LJ08_HALO1|nr:hypothetical protein [Haliangium ochraceum]ACY13037.1 hypothetical protein Hoch_0396 [Haliangium ochraceum DSM 14365]
MSCSIRPIAKFVSVLSLALALCILAAPASAQAGSADKTPRGFHIGFLGGALFPLRAMSDTHQQGLAGGLRMSYTGNSGFGLEMAAEYSPLLRQDEPAGGGSYETQFATLALMPRFTLGSGRLRWWLGAGGGVAFEYERELDSAGAAVGDPEMAYAPAGMGATGLELHIVNGVALAALGSYTRTLGDFEYEFVTVTGGLLLTFR